MPALQGLLVGLYGDSTGAEPGYVLRIKLFGFALFIWFVGLEWKRLIESVKDNYKLYLKFDKKSLFFIDYAI